MRSMVTLATLKRITNLLKAFNSIVSEWKAYFTKPYFSKVTVLPTFLLIFYISILPYYTFKLFVLFFLPFIPLSLTYISFTFPVSHIFGGQCYTSSLFTSLLGAAAPLGPWEDWEKNFVVRASSLSSSFVILIYIIQFVKGESIWQRLVRGVFWGVFQV